MPGLDSHYNYNGMSLAWVTFVAGACLGAGVALLGAPHMGAEPRTGLRSNASKPRDEVMEEGRAAWDTITVGGAPRRTPSRAARRP